MFATLKSRLTLCLFTAVLCSVLLPVNASVMHDLYEARVAIPDQTLKSQTVAVRNGFKQVVVKVSGTKQLLTSEQIAREVKRAKDFISTYRFEQSNEQLYFVVSFDAQRLEKMIRDAGFPIWDKRRPDTILWFTIQDPLSGKRQLVTESDYPQFVAQTNETAVTRGIKVVHPLLDLEDLQQVSSYDVWGGFVHQLAQASERYRVTNILSARLYQSSPAEDINTSAPFEQWTADWTMLDGDRLLSGKVQQASPELTVQGVIDALADNLAARYAIDISKLDPGALKTEVKIMNLDSLKHYANIVDFLNSLSVVNKASLIMLQGQVATFELDLLGSIDDFVKAMSLDNRLKPVEVFGLDQQDLEFIWVL
ncbi:MAG: hypothetical protein ACI9C4_002224 [Paraglaciecola sp.]|jgi:hypothetical protein